MVCYVSENSEWDFHKTGSSDIPYVIVSEINLHTSCCLALPVSERNCQFYPENILWIQNIIVKCLRTK